MAATLEDIKGWLKQAIHNGASHMIVVCDTYDWRDYPVFVMPGDDPRNFKPGSSEKIMECYAMHVDINAQLGEHRARHFEMPPEAP